MANKQGLNRGLWAGAAIVLVGVFVAYLMGLFPAGQDDSALRAPTGAREFGALDLGSDSAFRKAAEAEREALAAAANAREEELGDDGLDEGRVAPLGSGKRYAVAGRPALPFNGELLEAQGYRPEDIARIEEGFESILSTMRGPDPDAKIPAPYRLNPEEREQNRALRARILDPAEFDAAMYATRQLNRAYFKVGPQIGSSADKAGILKGDEIIEINGVRVYDIYDFTDGRDSVSEGEMHRLVVSRRGQLFDVSLRCCKPGWRGVALKLSKPLEAERKR